MEWAHIAVGLDDRLADRILRRIRFTDRAIQQRDTVPTLKIRGVGQHQIRIRHHFRIERIGINDPRDFVLAGFRVGVGQHFHRARRVHRRIPAHVGHEHKQRVDGVRIALPCVRNHHVHQAVRRQREFPRKRFVDAPGLAFGVHQQIFGAGRKAQRRSFQRLTGLHVARLARRLQRRRNGFRERRLITETTRHVDRADDCLQQVNRAAGMEPVRVRRNAAHRVHRHRTANEFIVLTPVRIDPRGVDLDGFLERNVRDLGSNTANGVGRNAGLTGDRVRGIFCVQVARRHQLERRRCRPPIVQSGIAGKHRLGVDIGGPLQCLFFAVPNQRVSFGIAGEQTVVGTARILNHQPRRIGVGRQVLFIHIAGAQQFMDQRHHKQAVRARLDAQPLVSNRGITGTHRVDRDELGAPPFDFTEPGFDRVGIVVFGDAEHQHVFGAIPIGLAEFPKRAADGI